MKQHEGCLSFTFKMCDDVAQIILKEQSKSILMGKFRGRQQIINRIIREWNHSNLLRSDSGTETLETGKI
jgi:hypothetical protein